MQFHLLGTPNYIGGWETSPNNPFNTKIIYMARMLKRMGHTSFYYGVEGSVIPDAEVIPVISKKEFEKIYGSRRRNDIDHLSESSGPIWTDFNYRTVEEVQKRFKDTNKEFLINFMGYAHRPLTDKVKDKIICIEPGIGHAGMYLEHKAFESYAWQNFLYAKSNTDYNVFPNMYDRVIPAYFDKNDYPFSATKEDYFVFIGRKTWGKGLSVAIDLTYKLGKKLVVIGGGSLEEARNTCTCKSTDHVEETGVLSLKHKVRYLSRAKALIYFSLYVEPFGHAPVEAMMCGTPVISSDLGAFSETVQHNVTGFRCRNWNELVWAGKLVQTLDPAKIRKYAEDNYSLEATIPKYEEWFSSLIALKNGGGWYDLSEEVCNFNVLEKKYAQK